jgi:two-component sensor histidine kinase
MSLVNRFMANRDRVTLKTPQRLRARRLWTSRRRSDNPDVALLQRELEASERELREARLLIERYQSDSDEKNGEVEALRRVGEATGSALDLEEMLKLTADVAVQVTGTDSCQVYLFDPVKEELVLRAADATAQSMIGKIRLRVGEGITGWVARERKPVAVVRNAFGDHRFKYFPGIREEEYESMLSVPLVVKGEMLGVINVRTLRPHEYTKHQMRLLSGIANQVAGAIEKTRRARQFERTADQLTTLSEVSQAIASNVYIDEVLHLFVEIVARTMNYKICTVLLVDGDKKELILKATQASSDDYTKKPRPKVGESIAGRAVVEQQVKTVEDVRRHPDYMFPDVAEKAGLCSLACVPLLFHGKVIGVLNCYTEKPHTFAREELTILQALAGQAAFAIEHAKLMVKSAVVQEMHHRVKNNLQQIASLVRLQSHFNKYTSVEQAMQDTLGRILAIAAVHELLSRDDLDTVSIKKVAEQIVVATKQSVIAPTKHVMMHVSGDDIRLPLNEATSLALVVNELVQNAVEHGFKDRDEGRIAVELHKGDREIVVTVFNDGAPLPEGFEPGNPGSLGLRIVNDLVRGGLGGSFHLESQDGILATVRLPH